MSGAVQGSSSQTALIIAHSAAVSSVLAFGIACLSLGANISTVVEDVNSNLYTCREQEKLCNLSALSALYTLSASTSGRYAARRLDRAGGMCLAARGHSRSEEHTSEL